MKRKAIAINLEIEQPWKKKKASWKVYIYSYRVLIVIEFGFRKKKKKIYIYISILLFKGLPLFEFLIFQFKNAPTPLCLSRDKTKGHFGKNATLTPIKTLSKK